ncbi:hypothetical protein MMC09_006881 [Bachmanniomyces sp. S44760]|nr:hypothetical protein [Bachmanniomyces sp. S44760]
MVKRVYFGNWLRDYSQAVDVGTLKGVQSATIRILIWILSFLSFGYATAEFEVTEERLGVYRPEEHIDNPKDYADNVDAREYDERLRPPVERIELEIDERTGMKNYIANEDLPIATSVGYVKYSFTRSIHFGRLYTSGASGLKGREEDLYEALRCLGQGLHCLEDFGAHTNYTELALRELGFGNVFPHVGHGTEIDLRGRRVFPLVTGTFGAVDFLHSVLGEATDHFAQTEVEELDIALGDAQAQSNRDASRGPVQQASYLTTLLGQVPGAGPLMREAEELQASSREQEQENAAYISRDASQPFAAELPGSEPRVPGGDQARPETGHIPGLSADFDPQKTIRQIYPILEFRDKVVKLIAKTIEKIPGLESLVEKITDTLTLFVLSLLAPFVRPVINAVAKQLKAGSSTVVDASGKHQYEVWTDPICSDPTHSLLSKDHFSNILNDPAGHVACTIVSYVAPRIIFAWQHPDVPIEEVLTDITRVFHHPAARDQRCELHNKMFSCVDRWAYAQPNRGADLNNILSADGVKAGKNLKNPDQIGNAALGHQHGGLPSSFAAKFGSGNTGQNMQMSSAPWEKLYKIRDTVGLSREEVGTEETAGALGNAYPGTETAFDTNAVSSSSLADFPPASAPSTSDIRQSYAAVPPYAGVSVSEAPPPSDGPYNTSDSSYQQQQPTYGDTSLPPPLPPNQSYPPYVSTTPEPPPHGQYGYTQPPYGQAQGQGPPYCGPDQPYYYGGGY